MNKTQPAAKFSVKKIDLFHRIIDCETGHPAVTKSGKFVDGGGHHSSEKAARQLGYITGEGKQK